MIVNQDVLNVLGNAIVDGNTLQLIGQLDRKLYVKTNEVLEAAGGKWVRAKKVHVFDTDAASRIDQIILTGNIEIPQDFGYYPTPSLVVKKLIDIANLQSGMDVLEPSAGQGAISLELQKITKNVFVCELLPVNNKVLNEHGYLAHVMGDFMEMNPLNTTKFDRVVMNPPFEKQADIKHVMHAMNFLKPDGLLVSVMSSSITFRDNKLTTDFREFIKSRGGIIEALDQGSFKESGTLVNTVIVTIPAGC